MVSVSYKYKLNFKVKNDLDSLFVNLCTRNNLTSGILFRPRNRAALKLYKVSLKILHILSSGIHGVMFVNFVSCIWLMCIPQIHFSLVVYLAISAMPVIERIIAQRTGRTPNIKIKCNFIRRHQECLLQSLYSDYIMKYYYKIDLRILNKGILIKFLQAIINYTTISMTF